MRRKIEESPINMIIESLAENKFPNVVEGKAFMHMQYDVAFGIYDHYAPDNPSVPWPHLYVSPLESLATVDPFDFRLDQFAENKVHEIFGISIDDLLSHSRYDVLRIIESAKKHSAILAKAAGNQMSEFNKMFKQQSPKPPQT